MIYNIEDLVCAHCGRHVKLAENCIGWFCIECPECGLLTDPVATRRQAMHMAYMRGEVLDVKEIFT